MKSKFDQVFEQSYFRLFEEAAPKISPEDMAEPSDVPPAPEGAAPEGAAPEGAAPEAATLAGTENELSPEQTPPETESQLPDPKEAETVKIDLLNMFLDFVNLPEKEQKDFLKEYGFTKERANSANYEQKVKALEAITGTESLPERSEV